MIKLGVCDWCVPYSTYKELFKIVYDSGLNGVELGVDKDYKSNSVICPEVRKNILQLSKESSMEVSTLGMNCLCQIGASKKENREWVRTAVKYTIDTALEMNCKVIQVPSFYNGAINNEKEFLETVEFFQYACNNIPDNSGLVISTENVLTTEENIRMLKTVNSDKFKVYYDIQNPCNCGLNPTMIAQQLFDYICEFHAKDKLDCSCLLGKGSANVKETISVLINKGYCGWIHLENKYTDLGVNGIKTDAEYLKNLINILRK